MPELVLFVLDLERGKPVEGMHVAVFRQRAKTGLEPVYQGVTAADGCLRMDFSADTQPRRWRVEYRLDACFSNRPTVPTFPGICVEFVWDGADKLVAPLLLTAHAYTFYRGS